MKSRLIQIGISVIAASALAVSLIVATPNMAGAIVANPLPSSYFGGRLIAYVPATATPPCPAHLLIKNASLLSLPLIGLYFDDTGNMKYFHSGLLTGSNPVFIVPGLPLGAWFLGQYIKVAVTACPVPYPVYPIKTVLSTYFFGTSLTP